MTVYLVGAGPGDPNLLTLRGAALLARAEVVVHDRLVDPRVIDLAPKAAIRIDVGKVPGAPVMSQAEINALLIAHARNATSVVRLKGGDPYVFGRGAEEALALEDAGIAYEVVPGVSVIAAVPAAAGVPLTMRGISSSFAVMTGHDPDADGPNGAVTWDEFARSRATLVILMGAAHRAKYAERLIKAGRVRETPVLVVEHGTTPAQRTRRTTLAELAGIPVENPATIVVGDVAAMHLSSYEQRPLFSWRVIVTRPRDQARELVALLTEAGASVIEFPTIAIAGSEDGGKSLRAAVARIGEYDWVIFSSENAVDAVFSAVRDARDLAGVQVAALGAATARALLRKGVVADLVPKRFVGESLLDAFADLEEVTDPSKRRLTAGGRVLVPRAAAGRETIIEGLAARGWDVDSVIAYQTIHPTWSSAALESLGGADVVTFTSSSTVTGFLEAAGKSAIPPVIASIGPVTSTTAREHGLNVDVEPDDHTAAGLVEALIAYAREHPLARER